MSAQRTKTNREVLSGGKESPGAKRRRMAEHGPAPDDKLGTMFQTLVKNVFGVIMVTAPDATVQYVTPSVKRILGYDPLDLYGKKAFDYCESLKIPNICIIGEQEIKTKTIKIKNLKTGSEIVKILTPEK